MAGACYRGGSLPFMGADGVLLMLLLLIVVEVE